MYANILQVFFRKGFEAIRAYVDVEASTGTSWIEMVGKMAALTTGPGDQVCLLFDCVMILA